MKCKLRGDGTLSIWPTGDSEDYALRQWAEDEMAMVRVVVDAGPEPLDKKFQLAEFIPPEKQSKIGAAE